VTFATVDECDKALRAVHGKPNPFAKYALPTDPPVVKLLAKFAEPATERAHRRGWELPSPDKLEAKHGASTLRKVRTEAKLLPLCDKEPPMPKFLPIDDEPAPGSESPDEPATLLASPKHAAVEAMCTPPKADIEIIQPIVALSPINSLPPPQPQMVTYFTLPLPNTPALFPPFFMPLPMQPFCVQQTLSLPFPPTPLAPPPYQPQPNPGVAGSRLFVRPW